MQCLEKNGRENFGVQQVANVVPMPKKDGKVRMCMDYRDLNRAVAPQNLPPHISQNIARKISKLLKIAQELDSQAIS